MKEQIRKLLYALWGGIILDFNYDLLSHQLRLNVNTYEDDKTTFYRIVIDEISSIIFHEGNIAEYAHNGELSDDAIDDEWGMLELTEFEYYPEFEYQIDFPSKDGSEVVRKCAYNLCLEIWDTEIDILARRLKINDQEFKLL